MKLLRQSTVQVVKYGPFVDVGDGATFEAGLATAMDNATTGIRLSKDGGNYGDRTDATAPVYDEEGCYDVSLDATDTATLGILRVSYSDVTTCLPHWEDYLVIPANVYDSFVLGTDVLDVNTTQVSGTAQTANDMSGDIDTILLDTGELQTNQGNWLTATGFATPTNITAATGITVATMGANTITASSVAVGAIEADAFAADAITAASIATDAIAADGLAADAVSEIQSGLATSAALATVDANVDIQVLGLITGAAVTGTLTTQIATTDLTGYTDDQLIGRTLTWTSGQCDGEQTDILDYTQTNGQLDYTLMTLAPGNGDTFKIS